MLFLSSVDFFFQIYPYRNIIRVLNGLDPDQDQHSVSPDLGPNCLKSYQQMTETVASKERVLKGLNQHLCM